MAENSRFQKLLEPGYIGPVFLKHRMIKTGSTPGLFESSDGTVPQRMLDYYEAIARGGAALVTIGGGVLELYPAPEPPCHFRIDHDRYIPSLSELAGVIKKYNTPPFFQLVASGGARRGIDIGRESISSSDMSDEELPIPQISATRALTIEEIEAYIRMFIDTAERVAKAGFVGIELNSANFHLLNTFLSRGWNKRHDAYGCDSIENRTRMVTDIIRGIKKRCGRDFVIISLINGIEIGLDDGITAEEGLAIARILQDAGADAFHVRPHFYFRNDNPERRNNTEFPDIAMYPDIWFPMGELVDISRNGIGAWAPIAAYIKHGVNVPVMQVGRLDADTGERLIRRGDIDFISLNRRIIADPDYPNKIVAGDPEGIRACTGCFTCFNASEQNMEPRCMVNAAFGHERDYEIKRTDTKKRVMVVGGGPAGMEAARVAASRGHHVVLFEKQSRLGGSLPLAAMVKGPEREDFMGFVDYLTTQMERLSVDVRLGRTVDRTVVDDIKPDVLVLAVGGTHTIPDIPGIGSRRVVTSQSLHARLKKYLKWMGPKTLYKLTKYWMPVGKNVVIMGGGVHGCQTAAFLVKRGRSVTIVESGDAIGDGLLEMVIRPLLLGWLEQKGTAMYAGVTYEEVTGEGLVITTRDGERRVLPADTVITALPLQPNTALLDQVREMVPEVYSIGDGNEPHLTVDAVAAGFAVGRSI